MDEYIPILQVVSIVILFIAYIADRTVFQKLHETHMFLIHNLSKCITELNIKDAIVDLQLGNIDYQTVKEVINNSGLEKERKEVFENILEEVTQAYNIPRN